MNQKTKAILKAAACGALFGIIIWFFQPFLEIGESLFTLIPPPYQGIVESVLGYEIGFDVIFFIFMNPFVQALFRLTGFMASPPNFGHFFSF